MNHLVIFLTHLVHFWSGYFKFDYAINQIIFSSCFHFVRIWGHPWQGRSSFDLVCPNSDSHHNHNFFLLMTIPSYAVLATSYCFSLITWKSLACLKFQMYRYCQIWCLVILVGFDHWHERVYWSFRVATAFLNLYFHLNFHSHIVVTFGAYLSYHLQTLAHSL